MPRKSAASLAVVVGITEHRPDPPEGLTEEQATLWRGIVKRMPSGWFQIEQQGLLAAYCQHASAARMLALFIDSFKREWLPDPDGLARFDKLLAMRERETRALASIATRLRLTPQSRYRPEKAATSTANTTVQKPWDL
jgi:hypothetical protein